MRGAVLVGWLLAAGCRAGSGDLDVGSLVLGANLPWRHYGHDFGAAWGHRGVTAPASEAALAEDLDALEGADVVRWFLFADGRALPHSDPELVWADLERALELADARGIRVVPVLFDYLWFDAAERVNGVQLFGRSAEARGPGRDALIRTWIEPLADRFGDDPRIAAFDLMNEPEWAVVEHEPIVAEPLTLGEMTAFLQAVAAPLRGGRPLTVGHAWWEAVAAWEGLAVDVVQVHHYERRRLPDARELAPARPVWVGELPSRGRDLPRQIDRYAAQGFEGVLPWSLNGEDAATDAEAVDALF